MGQQEQRAFLESAVALLVADVNRTLDPSFQVEIFLDDEGWWSWSAYGSSSSICGTDWEPDDAPSDGLSRIVVDLADKIPDFAFDDVLHEWPRCPRHGDHPLYAELRHGRAVWGCRRAGGGAICEIGQFGTPGR